MLAGEFVQERKIAWNADKERTSQVNGAAVTIRTVRQSDAPLIKEMHERLSKESIYFRYLGPNKPTIENLERMCSPDDEAGTVLVATVKDSQEKVVGIAHYSIDAIDPTTGEPAVIIEDDYQSCGLGKQIMLALCQVAIQRGLETFTTYIDPSNYRVKRLIEGSGLRFESKYRNGLKEIRVWLKRN
jgi:RimJ/RimL family protein N-acetyltransferase